MASSVSPALSARTISVAFPRRNFSSSPGKARTSSMRGGTNSSRLTLWESASRSGACKPFLTAPARSRAASALSWQRVSSGTTLWPRSVRWVLARSRRNSGPPQFLLELLDGLAQGGLCDVADFGRLGEVQGLRHGQEIADLMHFHAAVGSLSP